MTEVAVEYARFQSFVVAAGQSLTVWTTWWMFDEARVVEFDATPDAVTPAGGGVKYFVTFRNRGSTPVVFRPRIAIVPAARWGGGGSS
jgi:hypothetical protein